MFVSASLLVTFVILTAVFLQALHRVKQIAECTDTDSSCLRKAQTWIYENMLKGPVDPVAMTVRATGVCDDLSVSVESLAALQLKSGVAVCHWLVHMPSVFLILLLCRRSVGTLQTCIKILGSKDMYLLDASELRRHNSTG